MSHAIDTSRPVTTRPRSRLAAMLSVPFVVAAVGATLILPVNDDSSSGPAASSPAAAGVAVSRSATVGGPNETLRGQAFAGASSRHQDTVGGPDETARGQSAATASGAH